MDPDNVLFIRSHTHQGESENNDMWDDTALIDAYDNAVNVAKNIVERRINATCDSKSASSSESCTVPSTIKSRLGSKKIHTKKKNDFSVGDPCRCMYSVDQKLYEANVIEMSDSGSCVVKYVGYENEEVVDIHELRPSRGQAARDQQESQAKEENSDAYEDEYCSPNERQRSKRKPSKSSKSPNPKMDWEGSHNRSRPNSRGDAEYARHASMPLPQMTVPPPPPLNMLPQVGCPIDESDALSAMLMSWYMSGFHTGFYQGMKHGKG